MTPLQELMKEKKEQMELNLETFGAIIDDFLSQNDVQLRITIPKEKDDLIVQDNLGLGSVITFYILLKAVAPIAGEVFSLFDERGGEAFDKEKVANALCELVKQEIMEA